ncbi:MAG: hypothetical protein EHM14_15730, partial [Methanothrix sp.]
MRKKFVRENTGHKSSRPLETTIGKKRAYPASKNSAAYIANVMQIAGNSFLNSMATQSTESMSPIAGGVLQRKGPYLDNLSPTIKIFLNSGQEVLLDLITRYNKIDSKDPDIPKHLELLNAIGDVLDLNICGDLGGFCSYLIPPRHEFQRAFVIEKKYVEMQLVQYKIRLIYDKLGKSKSAYSMAQKRNCFLGENLPLVAQKWLDDECRPIVKDPVMMYRRLRDEFPDFNYRLNLLTDIEDIYNTVYGYSFLSKSLSEQNPEGQLLFSDALKKELIECRCSEYSRISLLKRLSNNAKLWFDSQKSSDNAFWNLVNAYEMIKDGKDISGKLKLLIIIKEAYNTLVRRIERETMMVSGFRQEFEVELNRELARVEDEARWPPNSVSLSETDPEDPIADEHYDLGGSFSPCCLVPALAIGSSTSKGAPHHSGSPDIRARAILERLRGQKASEEDKKEEPSSRLESMIP